MAIRTEETGKYHRPVTRRFTPTPWERASVQRDAKVDVLTVDVYARLVIEDADPHSDWLQNSHGYPTS